MTERREMRSRYWNPREEKVVPENYYTMSEYVRRDSRQLYRKIIKSSSSINFEIKKEIDRLISEDKKWQAEVCLCKINGRKTTHYSSELLDLAISNYLTKQVK